MLTWDAKITSVLGLMGGIGDINAIFMRKEMKDGVSNYDRFYQRINNEYTK
jgi:hypothetical protein